MRTTAEAERTRGLAEVRRLDEQSRKSWDRVPFASWISHRLTRRQKHWSLNRGPSTPGNGHTWVRQEAPDGAMEQRADEQHRSSRHPQTGRTGTAGTRKDHRVYPVAAAARQTSRDSRGATPWLLPSPCLPASWKPGPGSHRGSSPATLRPEEGQGRHPRSNSHQPPALFYSSTCAEHTPTQSINKAGDTCFQSVPSLRLSVATNTILRPTKMRVSSPRTRNLAL